jgi:hypothetical protein
MMLSPYIPEHCRYVTGDFFTELNYPASIFSILNDQIQSILREMKVHFVFTEC